LRSSASVTVTPRPLELLRRLGQVAVVHRNVAPAEQHLTFVLDRPLELVFARAP
jgi:hypothetical protein